LANPPRIAANFPHLKEGDKGGVSLFGTVVKRLIPPSPEALIGKNPYVPSKPKPLFQKGDKTTT
jgi:hypothetical protein